MTVKIRQYTINTQGGTSAVDFIDTPAGGNPAWGAITGTLSAQTDLQAALDGKQASGSYITSGGALGTPSSGALTNCTFPTLNQNTSGSSASCTGNAATVTTNANLTGDITSSGNATTIGAGKVTLAMQANMATASLVYRKTAGSGAPEVQTLATLKTDLLLTGTNSGDQTITLTGNVTGSGTGSFAATIAAAAVTNAMLAGSIDLTTKVTGTLPYANGGAQGKAATSATTGTISVSMTTRLITITPTGACTFNAATGGIAGQEASFLITTSGTTSFTLTWGTNFHKTGTLATGTVTARFFTVSFVSDGTNWWETARTAVQT